jgi:hypothetical protein
MPGHQTIVGKIVVEYLKKYPDWFPTSTLARIIAKENPHTFDLVEDARSAIKYYRGKNGEKQRARADKYGTTDKLERTGNHFGMPDTWTKEKSIFKLPIALKKAGFIADLQVPFHDPKAIDLTFNYLIKEGIDHLIINGDLVDFYGISSFEKDPRSRKFKDEYDSIIMMLMYIKQAFPNIPIYYNLDANHEFRYERYMRLKAPEFLGIDDAFEIEDLLLLDKIGIKYIKNTDHILFGKLPIIHGDTVFSRGSGVSPARMLWMRTKVNMIASHVHRTSEYTDKNFHGEMSTAWTVGHLMHPNVEYCKHVDAYNQGFAVLKKETGGDFEVENKRIYKGKIR